MTWRSQQDLGVYTDVYTICVLCFMVVAHFTLAFIALAMLYTHTVMF